MTRPRHGTWGVDLEGRDERVRPQDDFFRHTNGGWLDAFEIPDDLSSYGYFTKLGLETEAQVRTLIEEVAASSPAPGTEEAKIATLYRDFVDVAAIERRGLAPIEKELEAIRAATTHEDIAALFGRLSPIGVETPFEFYIAQDPMAPDAYIVTFVQSGLGLPNRDYYLDTETPRFARAREARHAFARTMLEAVGESQPEAAATRVVELETELARAHWPAEDTRDVDRTYNKLTGDELTSLAPEVPWRTYFRELGIAGQERFVVTTPSAYTDMAKAFASTDVETWRQVLIVGLLEANAACLPERIDAAAFRFRSDAVTGATSQRAREKRGVGFVNGCIGEAVGKRYVARHFKEDAKLAMDELVANVVEALGERIDALDWMGADTKRRAQEKLRKITTKIGYPDAWRDYSTLEIVAGDLVGNAARARRWHHERRCRKLGGPVDRAEWHMTPQTVNAYYSPRMNEIVFPAAILQPPFFDPHADAAVNYGGIGAVIAHEIGHGFDDQGRKFDGDGRKTDWWTSEDAERFQRRADMLVEQFDRYRVLDGMPVNGKLTLGENIGDLGGIEISYHAYKLSLRGKEAPLIDGTMTGDQRFFLSYAQIWRGKMRDELLAMVVSSDPHSPYEFRVNGAVRNVDAWYQAFGVEDGDALYLPPGERARIW